VFETKHAFHKLLKIMELYELDALEFLANAHHKELAEWIIEAVENGERDPLTLFFSCKKLEKVLDILKDNKGFMSALEREISKYGKNATVWGLTASQSTRTDYNFKDCCDPYLQELEGKIRVRKAYLKDLSEPTADALSEGVFVNPPNPTRKTIISLT
jgi:hypothetical protein